MKKYIATRFAFLSYALLLGLLSVQIGNFVFPILATLIGYIMTTKWIMSRLGSKDALVSGAEQ